VLIAGNTLNVSANDVRVSGLSVGAQSFKITGDKPLQVFENCVGGASSFGGGALISTASGTFTDCSGGVDSFGGVGVASGIFANCRLTTGSFPTIYIPGKMRSCLDADYNVFDADGIYDPDASSFFTTASVTDNTAKLQLHAFVLGVKQLGLWNDMVCWPLRSSQNAGTGSTAYSLGGLGTYNGTLINGPTWGADGVSFGGNTQSIQYSPQFSVDFTKRGFSVHAVWSALGVSVTSLEGDFLLLGQIGISTLQNIITTNVGGGTTWMPESKNYNGNRYFHFANVPTSGNVGYGWNADTLTLQTNGVNIVTSPQIAFTPANGNYTLSTIGRNNSTTSATSRVSYLMAFQPNIGMTAQKMQDIYTLAKNTLGQGLGLP
jgi:hypothetical protein